MRETNKELKGENLLTLRVQSLQLTFQLFDSIH